MKEPFKLSRFITPVFVTPEETGSWFGYYNYDTLSHDKTKMLSHRTANDAVDIKKGMEVEVGFYDLNDEGSWHPFGMSDSYNWPQGSMLQWLPGVGNENKAIYNLSRDNHLVSCIHDIKTGKDKFLNWSIYGLTPDGKKSIALDMERSYWCRAYHYQSVANEDLNVRVPEGDGIFEVDLEKNTRKRIISIQDVINIDKEPYFDNAQHWIEHIMISPNGKRFCFLHRFTIGELTAYETRLFIADIDGSNLQMIEGWRDFAWSHFGWNGDEAFTIYSYKQWKRRDITPKNEAVGKDRYSAKSILWNIGKKVYHALPRDLRKELVVRTKGQHSYYQYYELSDDTFKLKENFISRDFDIDGHPSFTGDRRYMITDSYPDGKSYQRLIVYDLITKKSLIIARIYAGLDGKPGSCDLHPKLCKDNNILVVDTAYNGAHHMKIFKLNWDEIKKELSNTQH